MPSATTSQKVLEADGEGEEISGVESGKRPRSVQMHAQFAVEVPRQLVGKCRHGMETPRRIAEMKNRQPATGHRGREEACFDCNPGSQANSPVLLRIDNQTGDGRVIGCSKTVPGAVAHHGQYGDFPPNRQAVD